MFDLTDAAVLRGSQWRRSAQWRPANHSGAALNARAFQMSPRGFVFAVVLFLHSLLISGAFTPPTPLTPFPPPTPSHHPLCLIGSLSEGHAEFILFKYCADAVDCASYRLRLLANWQRWTPLNLLHLPSPPLLLLLLLLPGD